MISDGGCVFHFLKFVCSATRKKNSLLVVYALFCLCVYVFILLCVWEPQCSGLIPAVGSGIIPGGVWEDLECCQISNCGQLKANCFNPVYCLLNSALVHQAWKLLQIHGLLFLMVSLDTWCREFQRKLAWWKICIRLAGICTPISPAVGACFGHQVRKIVGLREQLQSCFQSQFSAEPCVTLWATFQKNYMYFKAGFDLDPTPFPHTPYLQPVSGGASPSEVRFERQREGISGSQKEKLGWGRAPNYRTQGTASHCRLQSPRQPQWGLYPEVWREDMGETREEKFFQGELRGTILDLLDWWEGTISPRSSHMTVN